MTERLQQFNEGHSLNPSPNLSLTSSYSPNGTTFGDPLRFLRSQDFHGIFTRKTIKKNIYKVVWSHNSASFSSLSTLSAHTLRRRFNTLSVKREFREGEKEERFVYLLRTIRILTTHKNSVVGKECNPPPLPPRLG